MCVVHFHLPQHSDRLAQRGGPGGRDLLLLISRPLLDTF